MVEKSYKKLGEAREKFDKDIATAIEEYERAGAVPITSITPKRHDGRVAEIRVNQ